MPLQRPTSAKLQTVAATVCAEIVILLLTRFVRGLDLPWKAASLADCGLLRFRSRSLEGKTSLANEWCAPAFQHAEFRKSFGN